MGYPSFACVKAAFTHAKHKQNKINKFLLFLSMNVRNYFFKAYEL